MKNFKLLVIGAVALIMGSILTGCASMIIVSIDDDSVSGPRQVRQYQSLDPKEITVYAFYKDESRKPVTIRSADITFDSSRVGRQTVNINVSGFRASFETEVVALNGIRIVTPPTTTVFKVGTEPARATRSAGSNPLGGTVAQANPSSFPYAWTGIVVQGEWAQLGNAPIDIGDCTTTGYNRDRVGKQTITVTYNGKTATFEVEVIQLMSIRVASPPTKTTYIVGESIASAGISVIGTYSNNSTEAITSGLTYSFDSSTAGTKTVTVTAGGRTATFNVTVISITAITITSPPTKTTYNAGESLDITGLVVTATYSNGTSGTTTITRSNVTGFNANTAGQQRLTVTVAGRTATFNVTVLPGLNGTWVSSSSVGSLTYTFNNGSWDYSMNMTGASVSGTVMRGTYTTADGKLVLTTTHIHGMLLNLDPPLEQRWYTVVEINNHPNVKSLGMEFGPPSTYRYTLSGNSLSLTSEAYEGATPTVFTKR